MSHTLDPRGRPPAAGLAAGGASPAAGRSHPRPPGPAPDRAPALNV